MVCLEIPLVEETDSVVDTLVDDVLLLERGEEDVEFRGSAVVNALLAVLLIDIGLVLVVIDSLVHEEFDLSSIMQLIQLTYGLIRVNDRGIVEAFWQPPRKCS